MKIVLYMSMSLNGMIAGENDSEDFLSDLNWQTFCSIAKKAGCFVIGRKTYEVVMKKYKDYNFDDVKVSKIFIISKKSKLNLDKKYEIAKTPREAINKARNYGFKTLILTGGSKTNSSFMKQNLVDEIIVNIEPYVLGKGIKIFSEDEFESKLKLIKVRKLKEDIIQLHYKV